MATNDQAKSMEIVYPENCISDPQKKKYRDRILRENPDSLYADYKVSTSGQTEKREKSDLIFYTTLIPEWKSAIDDEYQQVVKTQKDYDEIFTIFQDEMHDKKHIFLTIHFYTTSIVLVQSREENLNLFEEAFAELKARVYRERDQAQMNNPNNPPPPANQLRGGEERAEERDQAQTAVEDTTDDFIKLSVK